MRFWDASALAPLVFEEKSSSRMEREFASDEAICVWCLTPVEVWSAVCRRRRTAQIDSPGMRTARARPHGFQRRWLEVDDLRSVRARAQRLLETHALTAADSLQLAAALVFVSDRPDRFGFVTLDERLADAAEREGFEPIGVVPP